MSRPDASKKWWGGQRRGAKRQEQKAKSKGQSWITEPRSRGQSLQFAKPVQDYSHLGCGAVFFWWASHQGKFRISEFELRIWKGKGQRARGKGQRAKGEGQ